MTDLVSIIVPVYNAEMFLSDTITSLINQSYKNLEVLLIDDGSTDQSLALCKQYEQQDGRIKVFHKVNEGVSATRNYGIEKSSGKYLMFVDSDDYLESEAVETVVGLQAKYSVDLVIYGHKIVKEDQRVTYVNEFLFQYYTDEQEITTQVIPKLIIDELLNHVWNKIYLARIIKENHIRFDEKLNLGEDLLFNFEYSREVHSLVLADDILYNYRKHSEDTLSTKLHSNKYEMLKYINDTMKRMATRDANYPIIYEVLNKIRIKNAYSVVKDYTRIDNKTAQDKLRIQEIIRIESQESHNVREGVIYRILGSILQSKNYYLITLTTRLMSRIRKRQGLH